MSTRNGYLFLLLFMTYRNTDEIESTIDQIDTNIEKLRKTVSSRLTILISIDLSLPCHLHLDLFS